MARQQMPRQRIEQPTLLRLVGVAHKYRRPGKTIPIGQRRHAPRFRLLMDGQIARANAHYRTRAGSNYLDRSP